MIHMSKGPKPLDIGSGVWHSLLMPATPLTITVTPEYALVLVPGDDQLFAQVRLDDEEESAVIEFHRHVGGAMPRIVGSLAVDFDLDAEDIYRLLVFMEAQGEAPYTGETRRISVALAAALGAFDRAFPGERP